MKLNSFPSAGTKDAKSTNADVTTSSQTIAKPIISGIPQRTIKFRAWDVGMFENILVDGDMWTNDIIRDIWHSGNVMQFTELQDERQNDIYENDIVSFNGKNLQVKFGSYIEAWDGICPKDGHNAIGWYIVDNDEKFIKSLLVSWMLPSMKGILIIGNVFETPELLG